MLHSEIKQHIHKLLDIANENQLNAVLEVLEPSSSRYSKEEIDSFYQRIKLVDADKNSGFTVKQSHTLIRNKYQRSGL